MGVGPVVGFNTNLLDQTARIALTICTNDFLVFDFLNSNSLQAMQDKISASRHVFRVPDLKEGTTDPAVYFEVGYGDWMRYPNQQITKDSIGIESAQPGFYRVFATIINIKLLPFEAFVAPNPVNRPNGDVARLSVKVAQAVESLSYRVYGIDGNVVTEGVFDETPDLKDGQSQYNKVLALDSAAPGVYIVHVTAKIPGKGTLRANARFTLIR